MSESNEVVEQLVLVDGTIITPNQVVKSFDDEEYVRIPTHSEAVAQVEKVSRKLSDLPDVPERMTAISVVLTYHMFGLEDSDIAIALGMRVEQVTNIKMLEAFTELQEAVIKNMVTSTKGAVQDILEQGAVRAAKRTQHLMEHAEAESVQLSAAKDILDRTGHRPADVIEIRNKMESTLKIEHIIRTDEEHAPVIDVTPIEVIENGDSSK
jgi:hypothetical protein